MPHGVRSHRSSQDNLTRTSIQGTLAGRNRAGHTSRRTNSHRSHQDHSRSDLASRDALAGCKPRRPHLTENQLPSIPPGSFPLGPCVQGCTRWLRPRRPHLTEIQLPSIPKGSSPLGHHVHGSHLLAANCPGYLWQWLHRTRVQAILAWLWSAGPLLQNTPHSLAPDKHSCCSKG
jgi:hypothetical protein